MCKCHDPSSTLFSLRCYGITQDPQSKEYMLVLRYAEQGDLRHYLRHHFAEITWIRRLMMLNSLAKNLLAIHNAGFTHRDLHTGNVLIINDIETIISDFGLARDSGGSELVGVIPYIAPERFQGQAYTQAMDIYSFSMLMWEICSGKRPLSEQVHDASLVSRICQGFRPEIEEGIPECYVQVMKSCWDMDPTKRPTSNDLYETFYSWLNKPTKDIQRQFEEAEN